ncbi:MAG: HAD family phosphatase [Caldilineaceae bacterium]
MMYNVIFDLGGVVFNWEPTAIIQSFVTELVTDPATQQALTDLVREQVFRHADWVETDRGTLSAVDAIARFAARVGRPVEDLQRLWDLCNTMMTPKIETIALMQTLADRGVPLYCLSNMPVERYTYLRQQHTFWPLFRGIVISGEIQQIKPDVAIYHHLLQRYGLKAEESIFLDDSPPNIAAANALGIHGILFTEAAACRAELGQWLAI